jgi:hypothetical protein
MHLRHSEQLNTLYLTYSDISRCHMAEVADWPQCYYPRRNRQWKKLYYGTQKMRLDRKIAIRCLDPMMIPKSLDSLCKLLSPIMSANMLDDRICIDQIKMLPSQRFWRNAGVANDDLGIGRTLVERVQ